MAHERIRPQYYFDEQKFEQLKQIAPECFEDGKINFETLRQNLGDFAQDGEDPELEHFGLFWPGKRDARKAAAIPPEGTLEPVWGEGLKADGTPDTDGENDSKNIFIEGENLEVLKLLQKSYAGKIKMIYIDPPYNTGNDFVYDDDFTEPLQEYLRRTGQIDEEGKALSTNKRSDGRFHSKWLSMMYPRLRLARNLLREDGIIFVSIDDNEVHNLRAIMNEIFGEENFLGQIIWKSKYGAGAKTRGFIEVHEYILCFSKNTINDIESELSEEQKLEYDKNRDENYSFRGGYVTQPLMTNSLGDRKNLQYSIQYNGETISPRKQWVWEEKRLLQAIENNEVVIKKMPNGEYSVRSKVYLKDEDGNIRKGKPLSLLNGPFNQEGTKEVAEMVGENVFSFPKPSALIKFLFGFTINNLEDKEGIYLDFFSGSGTIAQSIQELNKLDNGKRKFICIQIPELVDPKSEAYKAGFKKISDITKKRLTKLSEYCRANYKNEDIGFRSFYLKETNFETWKNFKGLSTIDLESQLELFIKNPLKKESSKIGLFTEILLLEGFPLCSKYSNFFKNGSNTIRVVTSEYCKHSLIICLDDKIEKGTIESLKFGDDDIFICLDSAISIEDKLRLSDKGLIKTI
jgi:adenine-specific DNA-methyltransferase